MAKSKVDEADGVRVGAENTDFMEVGKEVVPGMKLRCICRGHQGTIGRIAWSPCGRFIASPSIDKTIRIWDANNGKCLQVLEGHSATVLSAAWSPAGNCLASGAEDSSVLLWDASEFNRNGCTRYPFKKLEAHNYRVLSLDWSPCGDLLASSGSDGLIRLWQGDTIVNTLMGHTDRVYRAEFSPDGKTLASGSADKSIKLWDITNGKEVNAYYGHPSFVLSVAWSPCGNSFVSGGDKDLAIRIWDRREPRQSKVLEGHRSWIKSVAFLMNGNLIASKSHDGTVRLWSTNTLTPVAEISEVTTLTFEPNIASHPNGRVLATLGEKDTAIRIWEVGLHKLTAPGKDEGANRRFAPHDSNGLLHSSAKIVLVGESNVGKSCLAMRLAEDRYPDDHEHGTTHGMRFWPMEAEELHPAAKPPEGQRRDVVLWDFGGQDEYQLVHQMFLHDTTLALVLIDPTRGRAAMDEARDWNKRLEKHLGGRRAVKLLVGAKQDRSSSLVDDKQIEDLCEECEFSAYLETSAKAPLGIDELKALIEEKLDWDSMAKTSRPELFQRIRDEVELRREAGDVVVLLTDMESSIRENRSLTDQPKKASARRVWEIWKRKSEDDDEPKDTPILPFDDAALEAVTDQLATQGVIVKTRMTSGEQAVVLQLPVIEQYAGAIIIAARNNPRHVPALEERLLGSKQVPLPGIDEEDRLERVQEKIVLECIVELMIQHGICFRHGGLLVFPTLFPAGSTDDEKLPHSVSLYYDFTGAIDNIYASLVSKLMVSEEFGEGRLLSGRVEFDRPERGVCGIHRINRTGGLARIDLFFAEETEADRRDVFTRFVEEHLRTNGVEIREHEAIKCRECDREISEDIVQANIVAGERDVVCPYCRTHTLISEGVARIRERDPESDAKILALRKKIEEKTAMDVASAKKAVASGAAVLRIDDPIRLLHLSDLHFNAATEPRTKLQWLTDDLEKGMAIERLEYLVLSGDVTDKGNDEGFDKGREFVELLIERFGLSAQRCIFVPGNHDVQDRLDAYARQRSADGFPDDHIVRQGEIVLARDPDQYAKRLQLFSNAFFHKVVQLPYPLETEQQGQAWLFEDTGVQFLALNSAWEIDEFNRGRSGLAPAAVAHSIKSADQQVNNAKERGELRRNASVLRIAVWHHAVAGPEMMKNIDFIGNLQKDGVKLCLHGDVHEMRVDLVGYKTGQEMQVVGAGSFGSPAAGRPESTPRLYNLLEIQRDHSSIRVHTREQRNVDGAWQGWHEWPDPEGGKGKVSFFDIDLT